MTLTWADVRQAPRSDASLAHVLSAPLAPGVYLWWREGEPVYLGKATSLRRRLSVHRRTKTRPEKSTLRASVGAVVTGEPRATLRQRGRYVDEEAVQIDAWLDGCELSWIEAETAADAVLLEKALLAQWRPPLNIA